MRYGQTKATSYMSLAATTTSTKYIFFGDNGQGDHCAGSSMLKDPQQGSKISYVMIHEVLPRSKELKTCYEPASSAGSAVTFPLDIDSFPERVHFFKTHANATEWLFNKGAISCPSAREVHRGIRDWMACRCDGVCDTKNMAYVPRILTKATKASTLA